MCENVCTIEHIDNTSVLVPFPSVIRFFLGNIYV